MYVVLNISCYWYLMTQLSAVSANDNIFSLFDYITQGSTIRRCNIFSVYFKVNSGILRLLSTIGLVTQALKTCSLLPCNQTKPNLKYLVIVLQHYQPQQAVNMAQTKTYWLKSYNYNYIYVLIRQPYISKASCMVKKS